MIVVILSLLSKFITNKEVWVLNKYSYRGIDDGEGIACDAYIIGVVIIAGINRAINL